MSGFASSQNFPALRGEPRCAQRDDDGALIVDPETFFPYEKDPVGVAAAQVECRRCPTDSREDCLNFALGHPELQGVWGATTQDERDSILRRGTAGAA